MSKKLEYRIVQRELFDGSISYVVEKRFGQEGWDSVYSSPELDEARKVKAERDARTIKKETVIE